MSVLRLMDEDNYEKKIEAMERVVRMMYFFIAYYIILTIALIASMVTIDFIQHDKPTITPDVIRTGSQIAVLVTDLVMFVIFIVQFIRMMRIINYNKGKFNLSLWPSRLMQFSIVFLAIYSLFRLVVRDILQPLYTCNDVLKDSLPDKPILI